MTDLLHDIIHVHVDNHEDMKAHAVKVEEHEPEHFVFHTFVIPANGIERLANLDPMRKSIAILTVDQAIILCHTESQANSAANQVAATPNPDGAYIAAGGNWSANGTGAVWMVNATGSSTRVVVTLNRRGQ
jgi:hypothetical protein